MANFDHPFPTTDILPLPFYPSHEIFPWEGPYPPLEFSLVHHGKGERILKRYPAASQLEAAGMLKDDFPLLILKKRVNRF